jgi:hypothetical protein
MLELPHPKNLPFFEMNIKHLGEVGSSLTISNSNPDTAIVVILIDSINCLKKTDLVATIQHFKGIVSQVFEVCFFVLLDSSDIDTPDGTSSFFLESRFHAEFLIIWSLVVVGKGR